MMVSEAASMLAPETVRAYRNACYQVSDGAVHFQMRPDVYSPDLAALLSRYGAGSAAFITASNPLGQLHREADNKHQLRLLRLRLQQARWKILEGKGGDPEGKWPAESSFLVLGPSSEQSCALGHQFNQNALLWCSADAIPRLLLLR